MMKRSPFASLGYLSLCLALTASGCGSTEETLPENAANAMVNYANIVEASYADSLSAAQIMDAEIQAFVAAPSAQTHTAAKDAWLSSREPYLQTEVYRFYQGPIDNDEDGPEGLINAWPLDEQYIDYVAQDPNAGIINNPATEISEASLLALNEVGKAENVATGFHAIEFLLWGQDLDAAGPGARSFTDYLPVESGGRANFDRRGLYLTTVSGLLVKHLDGLVQAWAPNQPANYRSLFFGGMTTKEQLSKVLAGMIILSGFETGGERIRTALDSGDQEDEHSCFSDNTHRDMVQDVQGILNVWQGSYTRTNGQTVNGPGVGDVVRAVNPGLADRVDAAMAASLSAAQAIVPPFDQEIISENPAGRARVEALEAALRLQKELLVEVFGQFGLIVPPDPV